MVKIIPRRVHEGICDSIAGSKSRLTVRELSQNFQGIDRMTLWSIHDMAYISKMKKNAYMLKNPDLFETKINQRFWTLVGSGDPSAILTISDLHDIAPSMVARKLLECYLMKLHDNNLEDSWPKFIIDKLKQNTYSCQSSRTAMSIIHELAALNQTTVSVEESVSGGKHCITIQIEGHSFNGYGQSWSEGLTTASTLALSNLPPDWIVRTELQSIIENILNPIAAGHTAEPTNNNTSTIKSVNKVLSKMSNNPHLIPDPVLAQQTLLAHAADVGYGPIQMALRKQIGEEYELKLARELKLRDIPFKTEDDLRRCGYDKTPDIKLEAPIGVSGKVVSWIDSKAMFADSAMHKKYLDEQLWSYWNRFGPGLVIYWFGHVAELEDNSDKGILVLDDFPQDIVKMDSL